MDKEKNKKYVSPFTTKGVGRITGLGMAISLSIIEERHGMLKIYSTLDQSSDFSFYLPREIFPQKTKT